MKKKAWVVLSDSINCERIWIMEKQNDIIRDLKTKKMTPTF